MILLVQYGLYFLYLRFNLKQRIYFNFNVFFLYDVLIFYSNLISLYDVFAKTFKSPRKNFFSLFFCSI